MCKTYRATQIMRYELFCKNLEGFDKAENKPSEVSQKTRYLGWAEWQFQRCLIRVCVFFLSSNSVSRALAEIYTTISRSFLIFVLFFIAEFCRTLIDIEKSQLLHSPMLFFGLGTGHFSQLGNCNEQVWNL